MELVLVRLRCIVYTADSAHRRTREVAQAGALTLVDRLLSLHRLRVAGLLDRHLPLQSVHLRLRCVPLLVSLSLPLPHLFQLHPRVI